MVKMLRKFMFAAVVFFLGGMVPALAAPGCAMGVYRAANGDGLVITRYDPPPAGLFYAFVDGRRGALADKDSPVRCNAGKVSAKTDGGGFVEWRKIAFRETPTHFRSDGLVLNGMLIEPEGASSKTPLVVFVHGSEKSGWVGKSAMPYLFAVQGMSAFVYDKRGTGGSQGVYTQNFDLLADDAAAALNEARRLAGPRHGRAGFFGGSQGGWIAPGAAKRAHADFVVVGFGLILTPLEEDSEQVFDELRRKGYGDDVIAQAREVTDAVDGVAASHFKSGYERLAAVKTKYAKAPWLHQINGEFTGDVLKTDEKTLRKEGAAKFDNVGIIWHYDAMGVMAGLDMPQLWVLAAEDRDAPNLLTQKRLKELTAAGKPIDVAIFPHTDHGIYEFTADAKGEREITRHPKAYYRLMGDWIKGALHLPYDPATLTINVGK